MRDLALRSLIERAAARPPAGELALSARRAGWLRAAAELHLELGASSETMRARPTGARLVVGEVVGAVPIVDGPMATASSRMTEQLRASAPELLLEHDVWWTPEPQTPEELDLAEPLGFEDPEWRELDEAMRAESGVGFSDFVRAMRMLSYWGEDHRGDVGVREQPKSVGA